MRHICTCSDSDSDGDGDSDSDSDRDGVSVADRVHVRYITLHWTLSIAHYAKLREHTQLS